MGKSKALRWLAVAIGCMAVGIPLGILVGNFIHALARAM